MNVENSTSTIDFTPTEEPIDELENTLALVEIGAVGFIGVVLGLAAVHVIRRNSMIKGIVEIYCLLDLANLLLINGGHLFWGLPCALWGINESWPTLDYIFSALTFTSVSLGFPPKLFLSINRFFALSFEGRFYNSLQRTHVAQYFFMLIYTLGTFSAYMIPGCGATFVADGLNIFYIEASCGERIMYFTQIIASWIFLPVNVFFDLLICILMRRRLRLLHAKQNHDSRQKKEQLRMEMNLALQIAVNLTTGLILNVTITIAEESLWSSWATFLCYTALWQICTLINCISYIVFLREKERSTGKLSISMTTQILKRQP
ncbi:unnamed protein product, partial [Mesorhabditis spiculigera]